MRPYNLYSRVSFNDFKEKLQKADEIKFLGYSETFDMNEINHNNILTFREMIFNDYELVAYKANAVILMDEKNKEKILISRKRTTYRREFIYKDRYEYVYYIGGQFVFYIRIDK